MASDRGHGDEGERPLVLVVDDDAPMRIILRHLLEVEGCRVIEAVNGEDGLARYDEADPDLVVTDLSMPGMSGEDLARKIRARAGADPPVLAVSRREPNPGATDLFNAVFGKPVSSTQLSRWIPGNR